MNYYYEHPEANSLHTTILAAEQDKKNWLIELKDTIFYPEGGGQPADRGFLGGQELLDVQKSEDRILHRVKNKPDRKQVLLELDREHRDFYSIRHTGQHLLSALLFKVLGVQTLSVHLGRDKVSIEIDRKEITEEEILKIEKEGAELIASNRPVRAFWVKDQEALKAYSIGRPSKTDRNIRLVEIEGLDLSPCGGLHLASTAPVGLVKYCGKEKIRGQLRLQWRIGSSALEEYRLLQREMNRITTMLSVPPEEAAGRLEEVLKERKESLYLLKKAEEREAASLCLELVQESSSTEKNQTSALAIKHLKNCSPALFKEICRRLSEKNGLSFLLTCPAEKRINWVLNLPDYEGFDFTGFKENCLPHIGGKGGGRFPRWQGTGSRPEGLETFFQAFKDLRKTAND